MLRFFSVLLVFAASSAAWSIPSGTVKCSEIFFGQNAPIALMTSSVLPHEVRLSLQKQFNENPKFQEFMVRYMAWAQRLEHDQSVMDWLSTPAPLTESALKNQFETLEKKWADRIQIRRKKLILIMEILSHAKPSDGFENTSLFYQSMVFQSPSDARRSSPDTNPTYILNLLEFALTKIRVERYGIDGLLADPEVINEMMTVNRKFSTAEFQDGRSGIYWIP